MDHIEAHPEEYNQKFWITRNPCGTAYCFAGHAVVMTGWDPVFTCWGDEYPDAAASCSKGNTRRTVYRAACLELGLSSDQAELLFDSNNSAEDLRRIVDDLIKES